MQHRCTNPSNNPHCDPTYPVKNWNTLCPNCRQRAKDYQKQAIKEDGGMWQIYFGIGMMIFWFIVS